MEKIERYSGPASDAFKERIGLMLLEEEQGVRKTAHFAQTANFARLNLEELNSEDEAMFAKIEDGSATMEDFYEYKKHAGSGSFAAYLGNLYMKKMNESQDEVDKV